MTRRDASDLMTVVKMRARVTKAAIDTLAAERKADVQQQLSTIYKADAEAWQDITAEAKRQVEAADQQIAAICRARGIPDGFRPSLHCWWNGRGENGIKERRQELAAAANAKIDADRRAGHQRIDLWVADTCTTLISGQLSTDDARTFLASLPAPETLLPPVTIRAELSDGGGR